MALRDVLVWLTAENLMRGVAAVGVVELLLLGVLLLRQRPLGRLAAALAVLKDGQERLERVLRDELARGREEAAAHGQRLHSDVVGVLKGVNDSVVASIGHMASLQLGQLETFGRQLAGLGERNDGKMEGLRGLVEQKLTELRTDNAQQLERMRATVDDKLHATLEQRLGESFRLVSERLDQVHRGLGEMQTLASGVGDLKRLLGNVKVRGTWGEIQLGMLLEQVLSPAQYAANVCTRDGSGERVEFAIKLPGRNGHSDGGIWLPIDAKFPHEDFQRLLDAQERGDAEAVVEAGKRFETQMRGYAKTIRDKYLNPPATTDFGIMYLPTEGLYAEVVRRAGLVEMLQREHRVVVSGPTTLAALLNSLQMGFRTLAVEQRSSEVWRLLGAVKTEFGKFGGVLDKVQRKLGEASTSIETAAQRSRAIERRLKDVQDLPGSEAPAALPAADDVANDTPLDEAL
jgi:DNA recombination protein RmuC